MKLAQGDVMRNRFAEDNDTRGVTSPHNRRRVSDSPFLSVKTPSQGPTSLFSLTGRVSNSVRLFAEFQAPD